MCPSRKTHWPSGGGPDSGSSTRSQFPLHPAPRHLPPSGAVGAGSPGRRRAWSSCRRTTAGRSSPGAAGRPHTPRPPARRPPQSRRGPFLQGGCAVTFLSLPAATSHSSPHPGAGRPRSLALQTSPLSDLPPSRVSGMAAGTLTQEIMSKNSDPPSSLVGSTEPPSGTHLFSQGPRAHHTAVP